MNKEDKTNTLISLLMQDFFNLNNIKAEYFKTDEYIIKDFLIKDLKNTNFIKVKNKNNRDYLLMTKFMFEVTDNIYIFCYPSYNDIKNEKNIQYKTKVCQFLFRLQEFEREINTYKECNICHQNEYPLYLSVKCFHEICEDCTKKILGNECPFCRISNPKWTVFPPFKQEIKKKQIKGINKNI